MKRILYTTAAVLWLAIPVSASAQQAVVCVNCSTLYNQIASWAKQVAQMEQQITTLESQLTQQEMMVQRLASTVNPNTYTSQLNSLEQPLTSATQIPNEFSQWHTVPMTYSGSSTFLTNNQVYKPTGTDFAATEMNANAQGLANFMAMMSRQLTAINTDITDLTSLRGQINSGTSQADISNLNARISAATANLQAQQIQVNTLRAQLAAETQVNQQRQIQSQREDDDNLAAFFGASVPAQSTTSPYSSPVVALNQ